LSKEGDRERMDLSNLCLGHHFDFEGFKTREDDSTIGNDVYIILTLCCASVVLPSNSRIRSSIIQPFNQQSCLLPSTFTCTTYIAPLIVALCSGVIDNVVEVLVVTMVTVSQSSHGNFPFQKFQCSGRSDYTDILATIQSISMLDFL
jgi:hypothetical protein